LVIKELVGPWVFGVGMFSSLLIAATYLGRLAGYLVMGIPVSLVMELTAMLLPAMVVKTFSMSMLLSSLLAFGRLSSDSEIVALRAGGASLFRIIFPVAVFSLVVAMGTFAFNESIVPTAGQRSVALENRIAQIRTPGVGPPLSKAISHNGRLQLGISAAHVDTATGELHGFSAVVYDSHEKPIQIMTAPLVLWAGPNSPQKFLVPQGARIISLVDPRSEVDVTGEIWPGEVPPIGMTFGALIAIKDDDFDAINMRELADRIRIHREKDDLNKHDMANYQYGYWNKISVPLAALVFGCLGAVLGIRNHRTGTAAGFALAVAIIFGYFMLANFMNVWALGGVMPAWVASFSPLVIGIVATIVIMKRRNA
jgi:lipopolysaccharide export system permease protein